MPRGWKRHHEEVYCEKCWGQRFVLRAIIMPIVSPIETTWQDLNDRLNRMFRATTMASNWMVAELAKRDVTRLPSEAKMPKMRPVYLYPEARVQFPEMPSQSLASIALSVQRRYRSKRYDVIWKCAAALPTYRFPQPFPVHNQCWTPTMIDETPRVTVLIADGPVMLRLKGGSRYRRQLAAFHAMCSGQAKYGQLHLYRSGPDLVCKMIAWLPRSDPKATQISGALYVRTASEALLIAANAKNETIWRYNASHIREWVAERRTQLQRWREDSLAGQRPIPHPGRRDAAAAKYSHRMSTAADQGAAYLAKYALRQKIALVEYDDSERSHCPEFVWFRLRERIAMLLDEHGVKFHLRTQETTIPLQTLKDQQED
jgi:hypothetical protein